MDILKFPHPSLFNRCVEVTVFEKELKTLLDSMWETMKKHHGMGLASNQVGLRFRMFVMEGPEESKYYFVNPRITWRSAAPASLREGCLSAPGEFLVLKDRSQVVRVEYENEFGSTSSATFGGIWAVCIQHEIDHLDGKSHLQSKSISKIKRKELSKKWGI